MWASSASPCTATAECRGLLACLVREAAQWGRLPGLPVSAERQARGRPHGVCQEIVMKLRALFCLILVCPLALSRSGPEQACPTQSGYGNPSLAEQGTATQLIVDGKPFRLYPENWPTAPPPASTT